MNRFTQLCSMACTAFLLSACIISENENDAGTYPCKTDQDCMRGYECDLNHPNLSNFEDDFPDGLEGIGLCVPPGQSTGSDASDATDATDPSDASDATDSTDPSDSQSGNDPQACPGESGLMDCVDGAESVAPPNANPTCVPVDDPSGPRQCSFICNEGFTVPNALYNSCVLEGSSPGMAQSWDGTFVRGCQSCSDEELSTQFEMEVAPFEIDLTEVTVEAYRICVTSGDCERPADGGTYADTGSHQFPVTNVTQVQAAEYCKLQGKRLPTEAEWEAAARVSGTNESRVISDFPWGDSPEPDCYNSVLANNDQACPRGAPVEVGSSPRGHSFYGVADLSGNVREWVFDRYLADTYSVNVQDRGAYGGDNNATLSDAVIRGGSYNTPNDPNAYGWFRNGAARESRANDLGFRCAKLKSSRDNGQECIADVDCTSQNCSISDGVIRGVCQSN